MVNPNPYKNMFSWNRLMLIMAVALIVSPYSAQGATYTSIAGTTNWTTTSTWDQGSLPGVTDDVTINSNVTLADGDFAEINNLTINPGYTLTVNGTLIVHGNMTMLFSGNTESQFIMGPNAKVVIYGDVYLTTKVTLDIASYFIVLGSMNAQSASGNTTINIADNSHIYVFQSIDPKIKDFTSCDTYSGSSSSDIVNTSCDAGDSIAYVNNIDQIPTDIQQYICSSGDVTPPTITAAANVDTVADAGVCTTNISVTDPTYSDDCSVASLIWSMSGATIDNSPTTGINSITNYSFNSGTTTITWTVTDGAGNTSTATQQVIVADDQAPTFGQSFANIQECAIDTTNQSFTINQLINQYSDTGYDRNVDPTLLIDNCTAYSSIQIEYMIQANNGTSDLGLISDWLTANNLDSYEFSYDNLKASFPTATMFHVYYRITDASNNSTITSFYITVDPVPKPGQIIPN